MNWCWLIPRPGQLCLGYSTGFIKLFYRTKSEHLSLHWAKVLYTVPVYSACILCTMYSPFVLNLIQSTVTLYSVQLQTFLYSIQSRRLQYLWIGFSPLIQMNSVIPCIQCTVPVYSSHELLSVYSPCVLFSVSSSIQFKEPVYSLLSLFTL